MKEIFKIFKFLLLMCGVFGADEDEVNSMSVMEGDSVTLNLDPTQIQVFNQIQWRFGKPGSTIAKIVGKKISYEDEEIFEDRLQLDPTGSLAIKNIRTKHSGRYKAEISHSTGTLPTIFIVTVYESPAVIDAVKGEMKLMSVTEGDPVILQTDVPQLTRDMLIVWRSGDEGKLIAKHDIEAKSSPFYDETDERFRDRLKLDQTGSLTITNTRTNDSGLYRVKISSNNQTTYKRFTVTVSVPVPDSGYSGAAVAGIVIVVLLLLAAAVAGVIYFLRPRITNLPSQTLRETEGDPVTLNPEPEIQRGDEIQWLFGDKDILIAEIKGKNREMKTYDGPDEIFKNKLKQGETTGSLTIKYIKTEHAGLFTLKIRRGRETLYKRFMVSVKERKINVTEGESVTLEPVYEIKKDDLIRWLFGDREQQTLIAEFSVKTGKVLTYDYVADGRFRDRLELNKMTGSLTIKNTRTEHSGRYKLQIRSSSEVTEQIFTVTVRVEEIFLEEDFVTLKPDTEIQRDDLILWMFGDQDKLIAQIRGGTVEIYDDVNKRFRDRLKLDKTGSLTITKIEAEHTGLYKLQIISSSGGILCKRFMVLIQLRYDTVTAGESVTLYTYLTEIKRDDVIEWRFGDENSLIAEIKGGTVETHDVPDERFRDRLELNKKTGNLIINDSRAEHAGHYKLKISSSKGNTNRTYIVIVRGALATKEAREKSLMKEKTDSRGNRGNESATVEMSLLNGEE